MTAIIEVESLGKRYVLGHQVGPSYTALRDVLTDGFRNLTRGARHRKAADAESREQFWALKDVSFSVKQGERVGIIGRNGAGKSTLLKVLSRITDPTTGRISITGRVASLLEVGTGFHPELTGRENIFLNGAILGMSRSETVRKFDEIVAFAEVERFLDTPVKRYSSGMHARLAFAVAAHLEAEILVVDEVLAVGDIDFQKKCLGRMGELSHSGRTVLFVSHNMATITSLCNRCILLDYGRVSADGDPSEVILKHYTGGASSPAELNLATSNRPIGDDHARLISAKVANMDGNPIHEFDIGQSFLISMCYQILDSSKVKNVPNFHFFRADGSCAFVAIAPDVKSGSTGEFHATCHIPANFLNDGSYFVGLAMTSYGDAGHVINFSESSALQFNVRDPMSSEGMRYGYAGPIPGGVRPRLQWNIERLT
jgi:lipopolysaccharide transport system ATP-binding protein